MRKIACLLLVLIGFESHGQFSYQFSIEGNVVDNLNNPNPGCSVSLLRYSKLKRGTVTDTNGFFKLYGVEIGDEILIEYFDGDSLRFKIENSFHYYLISLVPKNSDGYSRILEMRRDKFIINPELRKENVSDKIIFTSPNARKYFNKPFKTNQERLTIEAIISTNLRENELKDATKVYINNKLQTGKLGTVSIKAQQQDYDFEQTVQLEEGENKIEIVIAPPNQETVRSIPLNVFYTPPLKANLYLLTFGVQHSDLNFTDEDAQTIHRLFKSQSGSLFNQVFAEGPFIGAASDTKTIAQELESLGYRDDIREQDVVLIFGSSHGDVINDDFRILGSDWKANAPRNSSLSFRNDIIVNLNNLHCKKIIMLDACHSGVTVGKSLADANQIIANTPEGTITITSSSGNEKSYENKIWNNSAFVKAIREALEEGKANSNNDRYVTLKELFDYLNKRVPQLVKSVKELEKFSQTPQMKMEGMQDFPIYLVK